MTTALLTSSTAGLNRSVDTAPVRLPTTGRRLGALVDTDSSASERAAAQWQEDGDESSFSGFLQMARETFNSGGMGDSADEIKSEEDVVQAGARELVATAFFEPLFKLMREDPLRSEVVPLSAGEKMFGPMLHTEFAKRITEKGNFPLVQAVARSLLPHSTTRDTGTTSDKALEGEALANGRGTAATSAPESKKPAGQQVERKVDVHG